MELKDSEILHVARLARLRLTEGELAPVRDDLNRVLEYVEKLNELDLNDVKPTMHVLTQETPLRADVCGESLSVEDALKNGPKVADNMFVVPRIMDGGQENA